jgi:branched-chain amino acid transport system ATP-binding protein
VPPADALGAPGAVPALEVRGVSVSFGGVAALTEVSLTVSPGTVTGLIGPNGAGKTTLFNVISGLQRPDRGNVVLRGTDVTRMATHRRARRGMGRTFQRLELFGSMTAEENVRVGFETRGGATATTATALLDRVGLSSVADRYMHTLPTGSARLVELARALSTDPHLVLLDEPCSGLDESETQALGRLLRALAAEGRAVLLVEHDMSIVLDVCDVIHVLDFGEVIATGTPAEIGADPMVQAAYLGQMEAPPDMPEGSS